MRVDRREIEGIPVIAVAEPVEVDIGNADEFKMKSLEAMGADSRIVLDVGSVGFFDSAGMAALLSIQKRATQRRGKVVLACLSHPVEEIFRMVGFDVVFEVYRDVPKAVAALNK